MDNMLSLLKASINLIKQTVDGDLLRWWSCAELLLLSDNLGWWCAGADNNAFHIANIAHPVFQMDW